MSFVMIIVIIVSHTSLQSVIKEVTPFVRANWLKEFLKSVGFYLTTKNIFIVQVDPVSVYFNCLFNCLFEFVQLEFPLHLTAYV